MSKVQVLIIGEVGTDKTVITRLIENMLHQEGIIYDFNDHKSTEDARSIHREVVCDTKLGEIAAINIEVLLSEHTATQAPPTPHLIKSDSNEKEI